MFARCLPLLLAILIAAPANGEPPPPSPAPDFAAGFSRLAALGLPALDAKAQWSTLPESAGGGDYYLREFLKPLMGNGWSLPADDGKALGLPAGAVETFDLSSASNANPPRSLLGRMFGRGSTAKPAAVPAADLAKDVRTLITSFHKETIDRDRFSSRSGGDIPGKMLLLATQIYQNGHTALANELAMEVFDLCASRETAVDSAVSLIADCAYESAARAFFASGDWVAYHRALTGLVAKFPRGWAARDAVAMLLPQLAKQAAGDPPPVPSSPAIQLDAAALDAIQQLSAKPDAGNSAAEDEKLAKLRGVNLASMTPQMRARFLTSMRQEMQGYHFRSRASWLIEPADAQTSNSSPLAKLTTLGITALPALAALVDDPYLTCLPNEQAENRSSYSSSDESDAERLLRIHTSLNRPSSRGEIACSLLRSALPDAPGELYQTDPETLRELALAFWHANPHATRDDLAAVFLRDGSSYQAQLAATLLASSSDPKARQTFEAHILAADPAIAKFQNVQTYLNARKAAAKPFYEAYAKLVRSQAAGAATEDSSNEYSYAIKQAGGPEKILKQLDNLVSGISPRALAKEIAQGNPKDAEAAIRALLDMMKDDSPVEQLHSLLDGAVATQDPLIRRHFLQLTYNVGWREEEEEEPDNDKAAADRTLPAGEIKAWQQLVADTRQLPNSPDKKATIGDLAASMLELSINPGKVQATQNAAPILRKSVAEVFREQAAAHLAGKPIPPLPDASRVTPDRLRAIITEAGAKPAAEIHPYLETLTPDERAAWLAWSENPGDISVPQSIKDLRLLVINRDERNDDYGDSPDVKGTDLIDTGFVVNPSNLKAYIESIAKDIGKHSRTHLRITPINFGPGLQVHAQVIPLAKKTPENETDDAESAERRYQPDARSIFREVIATLDNQESAEAVIRIILSSESGAPKDATWLVAKGKPKPVNPEQQTALDAAMQALAEAPDSLRHWIMIEILSQTDADKIQESTRN